jgi:hypothetical protein
MKWKGILTIAVIYLVIFTTIFLIFMPSENMESERTSSDVVQDMKTDIKSKSNSVNKLNPFTYVSNIKLPSFLLSTHCYFRHHFQCEFFTPDKIQNNLVFQFKNVLGKDVTIMDITIDGDITCSSNINEFVKSNNDFFIKVDNCTFNGVRGNVLLKYNEVGPNFYKTSKGRIVVK